MSEWQSNIVEDDDAVLDLLAGCRRIAVLGIKPESHADAPAHGVPRFLRDEGYEIIPVPVYYPDVTEILGQPVYRRLVDIPGEIDLVDLFRRPADIPGHLPDIIAKQPRVVWFQLGIRHDDAARELAANGLKVVQNRCMKIEHRRLKDRSP